MERDRIDRMVMLKPLADFHRLITDTSDLWNPAPKLLKPHSYLFTIYHPLTVPSGPRDFKNVTRKIGGITIVKHGHLDYAAAAR